MFLAIGALGNTNAATKVFWFFVSFELESLTTTTLKKCVGTCTNCGASPSNGYRISQPPAGGRFSFSVDEAEGDNATSAWLFSFLSPPVPANANANSRCFRSL